LLPLERVRGGEEAPEFAVEIVYFNRGAKWDDKGSFRLSLPALDLPISRTGLLIYYPPLFRANAEAGTFRTETYVNPMSAVLTDTRLFTDLVAMSPGVVGGALTDKDAAQTGQDEAKTKADSGNQMLVQRFRSKSQGGRTTGILPIRVSFPTFGPSVFLVSELTSAGQAPTAALTYQRDKKGGSR
jgi:hypothetical protein